MDRRPNTLIRGLTLYGFIVMTLIVGFADLIHHTLLLHYLLIGLPIVALGAVYVVWKRW